VHHFEDVVVVHVVATVLKSVLELFEVDDSVLVSVEEVEGSSDTVLGLDLSD
jgi:hypothetical protein